MLDELTRKTFHLKALTSQGQFSAVISTDAVDRDGEIVARDAFTGSLGKTIPLIQAHDWGSLPVGKGVVGQDAAGATLTGSFFLDTAGGQEAYKTAMNMADLQEFSIGFMPLAAENVVVDGNSVRKITDLELFEASLVLVGASRGTRLAAIKAAATKAEWDAEYVSNLPDSAFAIVLPGGSKDDQGKTVPRDLRKLPHHNANGGIDDPHLRNALSREPQTDMTPAQHATAKAHLDRHAAAEDIGTSDSGKAVATILVEIDHLQAAIKQMTPDELAQMHVAMGAMAAMHAQACDMGADCPLEPPAAMESNSATDHEGKLRELEAALGYRPLIADKA